MPEQMVRFVVARTGKKSFRLRSPWSSGRLGRLLAIGGTIYFAFNPVVLSSDSADRVDQTPVSQWNTGITVAATPPPQSPFDAVSESISHLDESVTQPEEVSIVHCVESRVSSDPNLAIEPVLQPEETLAVSPGEPQESTDTDKVDFGQLEWASSRAEVAQAGSVPSATGPLSSARAEHPDGDGIFPARHLERPPANGGTFGSLLARTQASGGIFLSSKLQVGYGQLFQDNSILARGNNGASREEPGCFYLKTCFQF